MSHADVPLSDERSDDLVRAIPGRSDRSHRAHRAEERLDLHRVFGNDRPVELEVGVGKGRFLLLAAAADPDTNFLGIEYARHYFEKSVDRVAKRALTNVRLVHDEAVAFIRDRVMNASLSAIHVYFPDPWPKTRHHKRRFFRRETLDQLARAMAPGAGLRAATDHADYAKVIAETVAIDDRFESVSVPDASWRVPAFAELTEGGVTNFEIKYRLEGRTIERFAWRRV